MSHSSYSASERRGIITIAIIALLLIGGGVTFTLCGRDSKDSHEIPVVIEHPEYIDSASLEIQKIERDKKKSDRKKSRGSKTKSKKEYRQRSPRDETV